MRFRKRRPETPFRKFDVVRCSCHSSRCFGPQQILRIDTSGPEPRYKVAYYNAIVGGRHWVTGKELSPL